MKYPINRLECERPPTNSKKNNQKNNKSVNRQHINDTPFHVDNSRHPTGKYIAYCCGNVGHKANEKVCRARGKRCGKYNNRGHFEKVLKLN